MGVVVAARHLQLDERVAIKFLLPEGARESEAVDRFLREAKAAVKIKSEHVARVIDVGTLENGAPYMVMEYLEGGDLARMARAARPAAPRSGGGVHPPGRVAVAEAHGLGIVHRDLKPANLFCTRRADGLRSVKVLDFGVSKMMERPARPTSRRRRRGCSGHRSTWRPSRCAPRGRSTRGRTSGRWVSSCTSSWGAPAPSWPTR